MSDHKLPLPGSVIYAIGTAIYNNGAPMTSLEIFAKVRYSGGYNMRDVTLNKAIATGFLTATGNRFSLTAMALAHFDGATGQQADVPEVVCSIATSRTTNGLTAPPLSKRHLLSSNPNWQRRDIRFFSLNSGGQA